MACAIMAGCGGGEGGLGLLGLLGASEEDLAAIAEAQEAFDADVEALPSVAVRIINETSSIVRIDLNASVAGPELPETTSPLADLAGAFPGQGLTQVASTSVLVTPGGTAEGRIKCGEVIHVAAWAPFDLGGLGFFGGEFDYFGEAGNVSFAGVGKSGESEFSGDTVATLRFIEPAADGLNCDRGTLVVRIEAPSVAAGFDPDTGQLVASQSPGAGRIEIE
jgi:hypothetical protein